MSLEIRPFEEGDIAHIVQRDEERAIGECVPDLHDRIVQYAIHGPAMTGLYDGVPFFCGGIIPLWPGVGEGWLYVSERIHEHRLSFHRSVWKWMVSLCVREGLHRLQVSVAESNITSCRWIRRLGFSEEGRMAAYGPDGSAFIRFAVFPSTWKEAA